MSEPRIPLEHWRCFVAVVEAGGYAQAAEALHKSQSAVTYAVQKLEGLLDVRLFEIEGRKAVLTPTGLSLLRRARALLDEAGDLEAAARHLAAGWEAEIRLAVDVIFPTWLLLECLDTFSCECGATRVQLHETVLSGSQEALLEHRADLAITGRVPPGFAADPLLRMRFVAVASPRHPLHAMAGPLTHEDLRRHRQLVIRDSARGESVDSGWLDAEQRWTVSHITTSIEAIASGLGFAWLPEAKIRDHLADGRLKPLPLREGSERYAELYLVMADRDYAGPGVLRLAELLRQNAVTAQQG